MGGVSQPSEASGGNSIAGRAIFEEAASHPGVAALNRFNGHLAERELPRDRLRTFFASMTAFVRLITPGIPALAVRMSDELFEQAPYRAHGIAAHILAASIDEYGLGGTKPHAELLLDFARYFGLTEQEVNAPEIAVASSRQLGDSVGAWYRTAPVDYALGMHTASEVTGYEEAFGFHRAFLEPPKYGLTKTTPEFLYVATHVEREGNHSADVVLCLDQYLALRPEAAANILRGCRDYMTLYERMFIELDRAMFG
ncbi:MAG: iron-containing redox enzyme family protein [Kiloniellales bacterium]